MESLKELCVRVIIALNIHVDNPTYIDVIRDSRALELLREDTAHHVAYLITRRVRLNIPLAARLLHHGHNREKWVVMSNSSELSNAVWYITFIRPMASISRAMSPNATLEERIKLLERFNINFKPGSNPMSVRTALLLFDHVFRLSKKETYLAVYH